MFYPALPRGFILGFVNTRTGIELQPRHRQAYWMRSISSHRKCSVSPSDEPAGSPFRSRRTCQPASPR